MNLINAHPTAPTRLINHVVHQMQAIVHILEHQAILHYDEHTGYLMFVMFSHCIHLRFPIVALILHLMPQPLVLFLELSLQLFLELHLFPYFLDRGF